MCQLCKHYGKKKIENQRTLRNALEEARLFYTSPDAETMAHIDALTNQWLFGRSPPREPDIEEEWERGHR